MALIKGKKDSLRQTNWLNEIDDNVVQHHTMQQFISIVLGIIPVMDAKRAFIIFVLVFLMHGVSVVEASPPAAVQVLDRGPRARSAPMSITHYQHHGCGQQRVKVRFQVG